MRSKRSEQSFLLDAAARARAIPVHSVREVLLWDASSFGGGFACESCVRA